MDIEKELFYREFVQREDEVYRAPYDPELEFYYKIKAGDIAGVRELCKEPLSDKPGLGILSDDPLQNIKFHFVVTAALAARYCIEGGMNLAESYSLSDFYIQKMDRCTELKDVSELHAAMCEDYAKRMRNLAKRKTGSRHIAVCLDYIYDHLHTRITVNALAELVNLNPSYLSKLFKKEMGCSMNQYIRDKKISTAKNMLVYSEYSPAQIAAILAFPSQSYFTEIFRKHTGMTPVRYRTRYFQSTGLRQPS